MNDSYSGDSQRITHCCRVWQGNKSLVNAWLSNLLGTQVRQILDACTAHLCSGSPRQTPPTHTPRQTWSHLSSPPRPPRYFSQRGTYLTLPCITTSQVLSNHGVWTCTSPCLIFLPKTHQSSRQQAQKSGRACLRLLWASRLPAPEAVAWSGRTFQLSSLDLTFPSPTQTSLLLIFVAVIIHRSFLVSLRRRQSARLEVPRTWASPIRLAHLVSLPLLYPLPLLPLARSLAVPPPSHPAA